MTFAPIVLADPNTKFDFKKYSLEYQMARNKELPKAKVPTGEQPPFAALLPLLERGIAAVADPKSAAGVAVHKHVASSCALYPAEPKTRELLTATLAELATGDAIAARFRAVQAVDRPVDNPTTRRADVPKWLAMPRRCSSTSRRNCRA